jgi:hypothetical protein
MIFYYHYLSFFCAIILVVFSIAQKNLQHPKPLECTQQNSITLRARSFLQTHDKKNLLSPHRAQMHQHLTALLHVLYTHILVLPVESHLASEQIRTRQSHEAQSTTIGTTAGTGQLNWNTRLFNRLYSK